MITENVTTAIHVMFLALTPTQRWNAARMPLEKSFTVQEWLPALVVAAQAISLLIVFGLMAQKRRLEKNRKQEVARLISHKEELLQKIDNLEATNESLQQEIFELNRQIRVDAFVQMSP